MRHRLLRAAAIVFATLHLSCSDQGPSAPTASRPAAVTAASGNARAQNAPPNLVVRTTPGADYSTNPPTISGNPPLTVNFGLCQSDDADPGDSLNWQYNFGDSGLKPFNADGSFNPDTDHVCRAEHTYREGIYTAWVSVTDKHLEDQSHGVVSLARKSQAFTIRAQSAPVTPPCVPTGLGVNTTFDLFPFGTPGSALGIPGVTFANSSISNFAFLLTMPGNQLFGANQTITWASDQSGASFQFATSLGNTLTVQGFSGTGALLFTTPFTGVVPPLGSFPEGTATVSGPFRQLVITSAPGPNFPIDNLQSTPVCQ